MTLEDEILRIVQRLPMLSEKQIASAIFAHGYSQRVNPTCRLLVAQGVLKRHGRGGAGDPFRYTA